MPHAGRGPDEGVLGSFVIVTSAFSWPLHAPVLA